MTRPYTVLQIRERLTPVFRGNNVRKAVLFGLLEDVCTSLDCPVDLIDTRDVIPGSLIDREIQGTGVTIYER